MRVVFLEDVSGVAQGGDVKEVKNGFARNYLIPKSLAVPATHNALQRVAKLARQAGVTRVRRLSDMKALAEELQGRQVSVEMRAGTSGRLYGSVTNTIVAEALSELTEKDIDRRMIEIPEAIRELGLYDLGVTLHPEVEATIKVLVYPIGSDPEDMLAAIEAREAAAAEESEDDDDDDDSDEDAPEAQAPDESGSDDEE
ncbi:MAG: 50S ribosomal protein L9 [SAR202 cluster bacterium]|jgi:large subunit ribosomal protein L9|nr:50S ribosomal protein L9 [SAR202 cluster bacterium]MDP6664648.1 50S ribosomal protein L9 [SAR202 cluster bacterium]MDP6798491.1 50S ribosomal protein L9 [SAR202 cluster bacterium]|tara:strand:- start:13835 stop:14431 length:597 start_codon:yes stop_codon:yes gene_type:complete